jgi:tRNA (guanine-N7-)-methyltransferase
MGHNKLKKFAEVTGFSNVFEPPGAEKRNDVFPLKGRWNEDYFKNNNPITLELGCGRGEYAIALAGLFPDRNYIGMDIKGARVWKGAKTALAENLKNIAFVRSRIDFIETYFASNEINEIWIPFPDPQPNKPKKRLVSEMFVNRYRNIAPKGIVVHLKTDNSELYLYSMEQVKEHNYPLLVNSEDVYSDSEKLGAERFSLLTTIQTYYEKLFLGQGKKIHYVEFSI